MDAKERIVKAVHGNYAEPIDCELCGKQIAWGVGDLNVTAFMCRECFIHLERRPD